MKPNPQQEIVIVSGLPRSGTSMMMKMLEAGGIPVLTDNLRTADTDNPKGYYEYERVKQLPKGDKAWVANAQGKVVKVISALLRHLPKEYPAGKLAACATSGVHYRVIFMQRHISEVLASQRKMLQHRGERTDKSADEKMATLFQKHLRQTENWLRRQPNLAVHYVNYNELLANPRPHVIQINRFFNGRLDQDKMMAIVDPALYRNRK